eukprot:2480376-Karenia_brevis.AAC.1
MQRQVLGKMGPEEAHIRDLMADAAVVAEPDAHGDAASDAGASAPAHPAPHAPSPAAAPTLPPEDQQLTSKSPSVAMPSVKLLTGIPRPPPVPPVRAPAAAPPTAAGPAAAPLGKASGEALPGQGESPLQGEGGDLQPAMVASEETSRVTSQTQQELD